ncbi:MAG: amidophosphoribosyltransferase [Verrucomicrobiales bacterium]
MQHVRVCLIAKLAPDGAPIPAQMSEQIKHECGVAYVRLRKPLSYFKEKYGDALWGLRKLFFLLQKQRNRGHDGVGFGCCKIAVRHGEPYMFYDRSAKRDALSPVFGRIMKKFKELRSDGLISNKRPDSIKEHFHFGGENLLGHLRYATSGGGPEARFCHPQVHESTWKTKSLMVIGNFNMTNMGQLKAAMINRGQHPFQDVDTQVVLEDLAFYLEEAHDRIYKHHIGDGMPRHQIPDRISAELKIEEVIRTAASHWDGGYVIAGTVGNGDGFVMRDPHGIRPCYYFENDEVIAFASERPPLMTVFNEPIESINELPAGHCASIKNTLDSPLVVKPFADLPEQRPCSFERIYFSRGSDHDIYRERKRLGAALADQVVKKLDGFDSAIFTFIPNTAETGYLGLMDELNLRRRAEIKTKLAAAIKAGNAEQLLDEIVDSGWPQGEKLAHKDEKFRTFISTEKGRAEMVTLGYDITYGQNEGKRYLVALDDSIVRGTTLKQSLIGILGRLKPEKIIVASTAPQIRYPDCYGIDMSELGKFLAFSSAINLLLKRKMDHVIAETYEKCKWALLTRTATEENFVKAIYKPFSLKELSEEMAKEVTPDEPDWNIKVVLLFQKIENLHKALDVPGKKHGDWYFTGDYPTPGGFRVVNQAFVSFIEGGNVRPYDDWRSGQES